MPSEEDIVDQGEDLDFDPEFDHLFYLSSLDDCLLEDSEYHLTWSQVGDQDIWRDHSSNECRISICGGLSRALEEGKTKIAELKKNLRSIFGKGNDDEVSNREIVELFYGRIHHYIEPTRTNYIGLIVSFYCLSKRVASCRNITLQRLMRIRLMV